MTVQDWGAIGEIVGAIAVVISIVYLAIQIKSANRTSQAATALDSTKLLADWHRGINQDPELSEILIKGMGANDGLTENEKARFLALIAEIFIIFEGLYNQYNKGFLDHDSWKGIDDSIRRMFASPNVVAWWDAKASFNGAKFRRYVDGYRNDPGNAQWISDMTGQLRGEKK